ncbi:cytochrome P450 [Pluteus cervinus]|uniref:Cytochrome P450 n=1 Tax=Pluteus cervinus TaxID=181527 RepID=A0ACD3B871_9AGAR|nr:cytochrome P450 [Pluteus cervinus]
MISLTVLLVGFLLVYAILVRRERKSAPKHPGPRGLPFIGNALQLPKSKGWLTFTKWTKIYNSPVIYANALGQELLIVNSRKDAEELLDNRAPISSDRPAVPLVQMIGWDNQTPIMHYGNLWRRHRKMLHQSLRKSAIEDYESLFAEKSVQFMHNLAQNPAEFMRHCKVYGVSIILDLVYGYDVGPNGNEFFSTSEEVFDRTNRALLPGRFAVNSFPVLQYLPRWFPGAGFHDFATEVREEANEMRGMPFNFAKKNWVNGVGKPSLVGTWLKDGEGGEEEDTIVGDMAVGIFGAGFETTATALMSLFLALTLYPEVQRKAQQEIVKVMGEHRLPSLKDRPHLPYLEAIYREILRWRPPLPLDLPHKMNEPDTYEGYFIPSGTLILANIWAMTRDESVYPEPEEFRPERFLNPDGTLNDSDDRVLAYGFGRRVCPGKYLASASVWLASTRIISFFDISKAKDAMGNEIEVTGEHTDDLISRPVDFQCSINLRRDLEDLNE